MTLRSAQFRRCVYLEEEMEHVIDLEGTVRSEQYVLFSMR